MFQPDGCKYLNDPFSRSMFNVTKEKSDHLSTYADVVERMCWKKGGCLIAGSIYLCNRLKGVSKVDINL